MRLIDSRCRIILAILSILVLGIFLISAGAFADEGNTQQKPDAGQLPPQGNFQELPSSPQYNRQSPSGPPLIPSAPQNQGAMNPRTGEYYPPLGKGAINPRTGEYYPPSGQGFINPRTGQYFPHASP